MAFEPNPLLASKLHDTAGKLVRAGIAPRIDVMNTTAVSTRDGTATFGLDLNYTTGSSLVLDKRIWRNGVVGGPAVGEQQTVVVRTIDAVRYVRSLRAGHVALKLDLEGSEFQLLRDLLVSGALCEKVDLLWVEYHGSGRINWRSLGLPVRESDLTKVYTWMLSTVQDRTIVLPSMLSPHCRTFIGVNWA